MLGNVPWEHEFDAAFNAGFIILKLIKQLVNREKSNCLCEIAECCFANALESIKYNSVEDIEAVITFIPDLGKGGLANYHHVLHLLIIEAGDGFFPTHLLPITAVLALPFLALLVNFVNVKALVKYKERSPPSHKEGMMLLKVRVIRTIALPHFPTQQRKSYDLVVN